MKQETGWGDDELKDLSAILTNEGGMTVQEMAEYLYGEGQNWFNDDSDARNQLNDLLQATGSYGGVTNYIKSNREAQMADAEAQQLYDYAAQQLGYEDGKDMHDKRMEEARQTLEALKDEQGNLTPEAVQQLKDKVEELKRFGEEAPVEEAPSESTEEIYQPLDESQVPFSVVPIDQQTPRNTTIDQVLYSIKVNHNSPSLLKKADGSFVDPDTGERLGFDHRFMNTGEGAQAHGWGSYFSVNDIRRYGGQLGGNNVKYKGKDYYDSGLQPIALVELQLNDDNVEAARKELESRIEEAENLGEPYVGTWMLDNVPIKNAKIALEQLSNPKDFEFDRHHYEVEIPDNDGTNYIEEAAVLSDEENALLRHYLEQEILANDEEDQYKGHENDLVGELKGYFPQNSDWYKAYNTTSILLGSAEAASKFLNERMGYVGIHYDGRSDGECYVIFDENDARIVDHVRFSVTATNKKFNEDLQKQIDGTLPEGYIYQLGEPSAILQSAGIDNLPMEMAASRLKEKSEQANHVFDIADVKDLPKAINNPIAVFESRTHKDSKVILTELQSNGSNFVAVMRVGKNEVLDIDINSINNLYPKDAVTGIFRWIDLGLLRYRDEKRLTDFLAQSTDLIADENLRKSAAKVAKEFENPKIPEENVRFSVRRFGGNSGYVGYSKSKRAVGAEERGLRNKSQMDSAFADEVNALIQERNPNAPKVTLKQIKDSLESIHADEWHHTSMYGNRTNYYSAETIADYFTPETDEERNAREQRESKKKEYRA